MGGGFGIGNSNLVIGSPGMGKTLIAFSFLYAGLEAGDKCIYVYSNDIKENVIHGFQTLGKDVSEYRKKNRLKLFDF